MSALEGKAALVTGGGSGLGRASAIALARAGRDRDRRRRRRAGRQGDRRARVRRGGRRRRFRPRRRDAGRRGRRRWSTRPSPGGAVWTARVNNAGTTGASAPTADYTLEDWNRTIGAQPHRRVPLSQVRDPGHARGRRRDREHGVRRGTGRLPGSPRVRGQQARGGRPHPGGGAGVRVAGSPRQRDLPRAARARRCSRGSWAATSRSSG